MKLTYYIDVPNKITIRALEGEVRIDVLINTMNIFWGSEEYSIDQNHLVDIRKADFLISLEDIRLFIKGVTTSPSFQERKVALLVAKPHEAAITSMYKQLTQHKHMTEVFASEKEALEYIGASMDFIEVLKSDKAQIIST